MLSVAWLRRGKQGERDEREKWERRRGKRESMYAKEGVDGSQIEHISNIV